jgi:hypothetical protein
MLMRVLLVVVGVFLCAGSLKAETWKGHEIERDGLRHVLNPETPILPEVVWQTEEIWRRGGADDSVLFGEISGVEVTPDGKTYVLDRQLEQVHVISADGKDSRSIGGSGEGPGEFRRPSGFGVFSDGTVCVLQSMPGRAVLLSGDGTAIGEHQIPEDDGGVHPYLNGGSVALDQLVLYTAELQRGMDFFALKTSFVRINREGEVVAPYWERTQREELASTKFDEKADASPVWAVGPDGRFYISVDWDGYLVYAHGPGGHLDYCIERDYSPRARTSRDAEVIERKIHSGEMSAETRISETSRDIVQIVPRRDGAVWVLSIRGEKDVAVGTIGTFDAFDKDGRFVQQVTLHRDGYRPGVDAFYVVGDRIYVVTNAGEWSGDTDEDGIALISLRIRRE